MSTLDLEAAADPDDPWGAVKTVHGLAADEVRSTVQKCVRRGDVEGAVLNAYELFETGEAAEELLWRRMEIMAAEDVGLGRPDAPAVIEALNNQRQRVPRGGERWIFAVHALRLLVTAPKDRTSAELAHWAELSVSRGERMPEVLDVAVDMHTRRGRAMGRGVEHFYEEGNVVTGEIAGRDTRWLDYLRRRAAGGSPSAQ